MKREFYLGELGFTLVVEALSESLKANPEAALIGHNCMYDLIFLFRQCIAPLPDSYEQFCQEFHQYFPRIYDTKVLSCQADYFGKTILGNVYEKTRDDKRLADLLRFKYDVAQGFVNYDAANVNSHAHEAAYDAVMTGYAFAKILKYKQVDEVFLRNKARKGKKEEAEVKPASLKNTRVDFRHGYAAHYVNYVMLNQYDNCSCFHFDPERPCKNQATSEGRHSQLIWLLFSDKLNVNDLSAEAVAMLFNDLGDFQVQKDMSQSVILNFFHMNKAALHPHEASAAGIMAYITERKAHFNVQEVCSYDQAPKFVAHDHLSE